jgi:hypothetical protein
VAPKQKLVGLPLQVVGPVDVGRLLRELEAFENSLLELGIRGGDPKAVPKTTQMMDQTATFNSLNLLQPEDRKMLRELLTSVKSRAPVLHMSFSSEPAPVFIEKLMGWLRSEIHPVVLLTIGLQPNIGAGCIVRSTNHFFDFSLRTDFLKKRELLMAGLSGEGKPA